MTGQDQVENGVAVVCGTDCRDDAGDKEEGARMRAESRQSTHRESRSSQQVQQRNCDLRHRNPSGVDLG